MCKIAYGIVFLLLVLAGVIDWKKREIPVWLLIFMSASVLFFSIVNKDVNIWCRLAGAVLGAVFFLISRFTKEAVGYGDSWIILLLGVQLGIFRVLQLLLVASLMVAIIAVFYLWRHKWKRNETLPFVPFLAIAYTGVILG